MPKEDFKLARSEKKCAKPETLAESGVRLFEMDS
jgi:hypothetical protein